MFIINGVDFCIDPLPPFKALINYLQAIKNNIGYYLYDPIHFL